MDNYSIILIQHNGMDPIKKNDGICLEGMRKNHKNPQLVHSQLPNHDSNQALSQIKVWGV